MTHEIHFDILDRSGGNGSRSTEEDWLDEQSTSAIENEWSSAETTFYWRDAPEGRQSRFRSLYEAQHGKNDPNRSAELPRMKALADASAFTSMLEIGGATAKRVQHIIEEIELGSQTFGGKPYEKIILAVITLVHDERLSRLPRQSVEYEQRLIFDDTFRDLMDSNSLGSTELRRIRQQIRSKTQFF